MGSAQGKPEVSKMKKRKAETTYFKYGKRKKSLRDKRKAGGKRDEPG
jgi:hypothetical protein